MAQITSKEPGRVIANNEDVTVPGTVTAGERTYRGPGGGDLLYAAPGNDRFDSMAMEAGGNAALRRRGSAAHPLPPDAIRVWTNTTVLQ